MNTCFFNATKFLGGGEKKHLLYAISLKQQGHQVHAVVRPKSALKEQARGYSLKLFDIKLENLSFLNPMKILKLYSFFRREKIDAVLFNGPNDLKAGGIAAWLAGVRVRIYWRGIAVPPKNSFLNRFLFGTVATKIIANSEDTKKTLFEKVPSSVHGHKTVVVYNGIDLNEFANVAPPTSAQGRTFIIGNVGRLTEQKGQVHLIGLGKRLKEAGYDFEIRIAGKGELQRNLQKQIRDANLEKHIRLMGFTMNVGSVLGETDLFVFPSLWEGFGFALVEAMACERACVAFNISSNPEIVADGETGFLVPVADEQALFEQVKLLIDNEQLRFQMGQKAKARAMQLFDLEASVAKLAKEIGIPS